MAKTWDQSRQSTPGNLANQSYRRISTLHFDFLLGNSRLLLLPLPLPSRLILLTGTSPPLLSPHPRKPLLAIAIDFATRVNIVGAVGV